MKTIYTATINLEISGDINRMEPEEIPIGHCDENDNNTFYSLAFTSRDELDRYVAKRLIQEIEILIGQYYDCKLTEVRFRNPEFTGRFICDAEMTYLDADKNQQYIRLNVYENRFKVNGLE